jgi:hypothetical protein
MKTVMERWRYECDNSGTLSLSRDFQALPTSCTPAGPFKNPVGVSESSPGQASPRAAPRVTRHRISFPSPPFSEEGEGGEDRVGEDTGPSETRERLGGMLKICHRRAA